MGIFPITLILLAAVTVVCWLSSRLRLAYPIVLVAVGLPIAFIPSLPKIELDPELVFLVFLPPLLFRAAATTDWGQFKRDIHTISLLAIGLVLLTMLLVAAVGHWVIGLPWAVAFVLGAIISPTDALAATVVMRRLSVPRRLSAIVEGESLVNDAGALVAYRMAIAAVVVGGFNLWEAGVLFFVDAIGGIAIGCAVAWLVIRFRRRVNDTALLQTGSLLTPFAAYVPAEELGLSGVLAVVACGLLIGFKGRHRAEVHIAVVPLWQAIEFILNGLGFILIGLQLPFVIQGMSGVSRWTIVGWTALVAGTTIAARALWMFAALLLRSTRAGQTLPRRTRVANAIVLSWSGMRGIVSLAAALAVPISTQHGQPFPYRHVIICLTFGTILLTLIGQGLTLPLVIRKLRLAARPEEDEETLARFAVTQAGLERVDEMSKDCDLPSGVLTAMHKRLSDRLHQLEHAIKEQDRYFASAQASDYIAARREVIAAMRQRLRELLNRELIDPEVWTRLMWELDLEEAKLSGFDLPASDDLKSEI